MQVEDHYITVLLLLICSKSTFQQNVTCSGTYFLNEGECKPCPDGCAACAFADLCTTCKGNYYGPVCQYTCQGICEDRCHKKYGYCTFGCPDGQFPVPNSANCDPCSTRCRKCKSKTECAECIPGYFGDTCAIQCSDNCKTCNKTTGACLVCDEMYFNQDGNCNRCPDGCASCTDKTNCLSCQTDYLHLNDSHCIMECPISSKMRDLGQTSCAKEDLKSQGCMDTTNGQQFVFKTSKPCIQYNTCSKISCPSAVEGKSACGTIKAYQCSDLCHQQDERYCQCEPNSNCKVIEMVSSMLFCFTSEDAFLGLKLLTTLECSNVPEDDLQKPSSVFLPLFVAESVVFAIVCVIALICWKKRTIKSWISRKARGQAGDVEENKDFLPTEQTHGECKESQAEKGFNQLSQDPPKMD